MDPNRYKVISHIKFGHLQETLNEEGFEGNKVISVTYNPNFDWYLIVVEIKNQNYNYNYKEDYENIDNKIYKHILQENELPVTVTWN